jgi:hypothetical protein
VLTQTGNGLVQVLDELANDIRENGLREPIVLTRTGALVDGRNRLPYEQLRTRLAREARRVATQLVPVNVNLLYADGEVA